MLGVLKPTNPITHVSCSSIEPQHRWAKKPTTNAKCQQQKTPTTKHDPQQWKHKTPTTPKQKNYPTTIRKTHNKSKKMTTGPHWSSLLPSAVAVLVLVRALSAAASTPFSSASPGGCCETPWGTGLVCVSFSGFPRRILRGWCFGSLKSKKRKKT